MTKTWRIFKAHLIITFPFPLMRTKSLHLQPNKLPAAGLLRWCLWCNPHGQFHLPGRSETLEPRMGLPQKGPRETPMRERITLDGLKTHGKPLTSASVSRPEFSPLQIDGWFLDEFPFGSYVMLCQFWEGYILDDLWMGCGWNWSTKIVWRILSITLSHMLGFRYFSENFFTVKTVRHSSWRMPVQCPTCLIRLVHRRLSTAFFASEAAEPKWNRIMLLYFCSLLLGNRLFPQHCHIPGLMWLILDNTPLN